MYEHKGEAYYRALLSALHENILVIDRQFRVTDVNSTFLLTTGYRRKEIIGRFCYEVSHGFNIPCSQHGQNCRIDEVFKTGKPANCLHTHIRKDGSQIKVDILLSPLKDDNGWDHRFNSPPKPPATIPAKATGLTPPPFIFLI